MSCARDPRQSTHRFRELIAQQPGFAEAHFRLARQLEAGGSLVSANAHADMITRHRKSRYAQLIGCVGSNVDATSRTGP